MRVVQLVNSTTIYIGMSQYRYWKLGVNIVHHFSVVLMVFLSQPAQHEDEGRGIVFLPG